MLSTVFYKWYRMQQSLMISLQFFCATHAANPATSTDGLIDKKPLKATKFNHTP